MEPDYDEDMEKMQVENKISLTIQLCGSLSKSSFQKPFIEISTLTNVYFIDLKKMVQEFTNINIENQRITNEQGEIIEDEINILGKEYADLEAEIDQLRREAIQMNKQQLNLGLTGQEVRV